MIHGAWKKIREVLNDTYEKHAIDKEDHIRAIQYIDQLINAEKYRGGFPSSLLVALYQRYIFELQTNRKLNEIFVKIMYEGIPRESFSDVLKTMKKYGERLGKPEINDE